MATIEQRLRSGDRLTVHNQHGNDTYVQDVDPSDYPNTHPAPKFTMWSHDGSTPFATREFDSIEDVIAAMRQVAPLTHWRSVVFS